MRLLTPIFLALAIGSGSANAQCAGCGADANQVDRERIIREKEIRETYTVPEKIRELQIGREQQMREYDQMVKENPNFVGIDVEEDTYLFPNVAMTLSGPYVFDRFHEDDLANNPERMKLLEETAELFAKWNAGRPRPCPNDPLAYCLPPEN